MNRRSSATLFIALTAVFASACGSPSGPNAGANDIMVTLSNASASPTPTTESAPIITDAPPTTVTAATPAETTTTTISIESSKNAWRELIQGATYPTTQPWRSDAGIYALAYSSDTGLSPAARTGYVLHTFDGTSWTGSDDIGGTDCNNMPQSCTISLIGARTQQPVIFVSWCCPMNHPVWSGPISAAYQVDNGRIVEAVSGKDYYFSYSEGDDFWEEENCSFFWMSGTPDEQCVEWSTTRYTVQADGQVETATSTRTVEASFTTCMESSYAPEGCVLETTIRYDPRCEFDPVWTGAFSLEQCEYGGWVLMAERKLVTLGFSMIADGYYDPGEVPTIIAFQNQNRLDADGYIGPGSWRALFPEYDCAINPQGGLCAGGDTNNDGVFGPGDIFPD